ncbi:hypothetical protein ACOMHN_047839 [Nucella lapillus]
MGKNRDSSSESEKERDTYYTDSVGRKKSLRIKIKETGDLQGSPYDLRRSTQSGLKPHSGEGEGNSKRKQSKPHNGKRDSSSAPKRKRGKSHYGEGDSSSTPKRKRGRPRSWQGEVDSASTPKRKRHRPPSVLTVLHEAVQSQGNHASVSFNQIEPCPHASCFDDYKFQAQERVIVPVPQAPSSPPPPPLFGPPKPPSPLFGPRPGPSGI